MKIYINPQRALPGLLLALFIPSLALASLDSVSAPDDPASAVYKTDDIYNRLQSGAVGAKRSGGFTEPSAGPAAGARKTLDELMGAAPAADNVTGALPAEVKSGKSYWGLRSDGGGWGKQTGAAIPAIPAPVPRTGQTTSYATGDDGAKQKGVPLPNPRFTDKGDGTVSDNLTGLIWLKNANCTASFASVSKKWSDVLTAVAALKSGDCSLSDGSAAGDWRLPNQKELASLVNLQYYGPALSNNAGTAQWTSGLPFSNVPTSVGISYWSSTPYTPSPSTSIYVVDFYAGLVSSVFKTATTSSYVWPVRGGQ